MHSFCAFLSSVLFNALYSLPITAFINVEYSLRAVKSVFNSVALHGHMCVMEASASA